MKLFAVLALLILSCSTQQQLATHTIEKPIVVTDTITQTKNQQIIALLSESLNQLNLTDTLASEILHDSVHSQLSNFTEDEINQLLTDSNFIKVATPVYAFHHSFLELDSTTSSKEQLEYTLKLHISNQYETIETDTDTLAGNLPEVKDSVTYSIPVTMNKVVERHMKYLLGKRGRRTMKVWLERGQLYKPLIQRILKEEGLPEDLYYLAMIESGFNLNAKSWASAVGPWQFIKATGKYYGLNSTYWADDRRDIENATRAAAKHLKDLYARFGDWYLAMAGYNCNPAKIARRVRSQKTTDYFKLKNIPRETRGYVPQFIAAMVISKNHEKYGIEYEQKPPLAYDRIYVKDVIDLNHISKASGISFQEIKQLNPAILKWVTPSDRDSMYVNVPAGTGDKVLAYIDSLPSDQKQKYLRYKIKSGDALSIIASRYGVPMKEIRRLNKMKSNAIRAGKYLIVPVPSDKNYLTKLQKKKKRVIKPVPGHTRYNHKVTAGQTLGHIAEAYGTHAKKIRRWNGLRFKQPIRVGQTLVIWVKDPSKIDLTQLSPTKKPQLNHDLFVYHKVKYGESLWDISKKYNVSVDSLKELNNLNKNMIKKGNHLIVKKRITSL